MTATASVPVATAYATGADSQLDVGLRLFVTPDGDLLATAEHATSWTGVYHLSPRPLADLISAPAQGGEALAAADTRPESGPMAAPAARGPLSGPRGHH